MKLILASICYDLSNYHKIFVLPDTTPPRKLGAADSRRIFMEIRAGGTQEGNGREVLEFPDTETRDLYFASIMQGFKDGETVLDLDGMPDPGLDRDEALSDAWGLISNAYKGNWEDADPVWRDAANRFRNSYFNIKED